MNKKARWEESQLCPELQAIIAQYWGKFECEFVVVPLPEELSTVEISSVFKICVKK